MNRVLLVVWLTVVWVLLWGEVTVGNVIAGAALGTVLVLVVRQGEPRVSGVHPWAVLRYGFHFAGALVLATVSVARTVLSPRMELAEGIVAVPLRAVSPVVVTFVANSITLTPGTLTVDIRPRDYGIDRDADEDQGTPGESPVLYVHCLVVGDPDEVRSDAHRFEELATAAFGSAADRRAVLGPRPAWPRPAPSASAPHEEDTQ